MNVPEKGHRTLLSGRCPPYTWRKGASLSLKIWTAPKGHPEGSEHYALLSLPQFIGLTLYSWTYHISLQLSPSQI